MDVQVHIQRIEGFPVMVAIAVADGDQFGVGYSVSAPDQFDEYIASKLAETQARSKLSRRIEANAERRAQRIAFARGLDNRFPKDIDP